MNYAELTKSYFKAQIDRVLRSRISIANREANTAAGRVVPQEADIPIGVGRQLTAAVMFLDICSFSDRSSDDFASQSNNLRVLTFFFAEMIKVIEDYGGVVEKNTGDGLMAYFPESPLSEPVKATQKAVACALTMFAINEQALNVIVESSSLPKIDFRICIDYGKITVAKVGAKSGFNGIVAIGTTANVANKMLKIAKENELLLGARALIGLPASWQAKFVSIVNESSGFFFVNTQEPYKLFRYTGRWIIPPIQ